MKHDPWEDWMGKLKYPISKTELLDYGLAPLIKLMNIPGKMLTEQSCLHDGPIIIFMVEDEGWFLQDALPRILEINDGKYRLHVIKIYDGNGPLELFRQRDKYFNRHYWTIKHKYGGKWKFLSELTRVFQEFAETSRQDGIV